MNRPRRQPRLRRPCQPPTCPQHPLPPRRLPLSRRTHQPVSQRRPSPRLRHTPRLRLLAPRLPQVLRQPRMSQPRLRLHVLVPGPRPPFPLRTLQLTSPQARPAHPQQRLLPPINRPLLLPSPQRMNASTSTSVSAVPFRAETPLMLSSSSTVPPPSRLKTLLPSWMALPMVWKSTGLPTPRVNLVPSSSLHLLPKRPEFR